MNVRTKSTENKHERSPQIFQRRRALFPSEDKNETESDLGHISPINSDSDCDDQLNCCIESVVSDSNSDTNGDYDIIGPIGNDNTPIKTYIPSETMSPLLLSPFTTTSFYNSTTKTSPSENLKTPHDSSVNPSTKVPKLIRKPFSELFFNEINKKRKLSPSESPKCKIFKLDSKVRTALFPEPPEDLVVQTKSFYPKSNHCNPKKKFPTKTRMNDSITIRKQYPKKQRGVINAGVRHSIKKPKLNNTIKKSKIELYAKTNKEDVLLSPTSQMCDMASGLAINSPKKVRNLTTVLKENTVKPKLFSIFYPNNKKNVQIDNGETKIKAPVKKLKPCPENQMLLDAGQKKFGLSQCHECNLVYCMGDPNDELMHLNYHNGRSAFKFPGWKNERVIANILDARIIQIIPNDSRYWWKKAKDLLEVINRDLGFYEMEMDTSNAQILLYIRNKLVVGCLVAVPRTKGHKVIVDEKGGVDLCSEEEYPIKCGISRIWVAPEYRKQGVGTALMNAVKLSFIFDGVLSNSDIAMSSPTDMGKKFAAKYFGTPNFLIFCE